MRLKDVLPQVDTHTHTVLSGHAWSTLYENITSAREKGLKGICLTEHGPAIYCGAPPFTPAAEHMLPREIDGLRVYYGMEVNITDIDGSLDVPERYLKVLEFGIASYHLSTSSTIKVGTGEENTRAYIAALDDPYIDMIGHPEQDGVPCDLEALIKHASGVGKLLELNNSRIARKPGHTEIMKRFAELCKEARQRVCISSDAHYRSHVGAVKPMMELLDSVDFPQELIVNLYKERFDEYLSERAGRIK